MGIGYIEDDYSGIKTDTNDPEFDSMIDEFVKDLPATIEHEDPEFGFIDDPDFDEFFG